MIDMGASVLAKLQNKAKETGRSYQLCLQLFCQEEFLRRVSLSNYADNLVLKGGLFIYTLTEFESRVTVDIDFLLRQMPNIESEIVSMVEEITSTDTGNDFISFQIKGASPIALQQKYNGISVAMVGLIKNTKTPFSIDFGIGDVIVPKSEKRIIPTQLDGFAKPEINTYSLESTIAEKFDAIISRFEFTSRMKDFYDIYYIAHFFDFDGRKLQEAIYETLQNRGTDYNSDTIKSVVDLALSDVMNTRWKAFLRKIKTPDLDFKEVLSIIQNFLNPAFEAIVKEREFFKHWDCEKREWS
jgi:predicted nucleotidyltransferase component of viral defense system